MYLKGGETKLAARTDDLGIGLSWSAKSLTQGRALNTALLNGGCDQGEDKTFGVDLEWLKHLSLGKP